MATAVIALVCGPAARAQDLDPALSTGRGSPDGAAIILGVEGKLDERTTGTAAITRQNGSGITGGIAEFEWKASHAIGFFAAVGYAVRDRDSTTHAVNLRAGFTYRHDLSARLELKNQTMIEVLIQDASMTDIARLRSRFELGYRLLPKSQRQPILFASAEPIADQRSRGIQQLRLQSGLMITLGRLAGQLYYRREEHLQGGQRSRNAVFLRGILQIGSGAAGA